MRAALLLLATTLHGGGQREVFMALGWRHAARAGHFTRVSEKSHSRTRSPALHTASGGPPDCRRSWRLPGAGHTRARGTPPRSSPLQHHLSATRCSFYPAWRPHSSACTLLARALRHSALAHPAAQQRALERHIRMHASEFSCSKQRPPRAQNARHRTTTSSPLPVGTSQRDSTLGTHAIRANPWQPSSRCCRANSANLTTPPQTPLLPALSHTASK